MTILSAMRNLNFLIWVEMFKQFAHIFPLNNICILGLGIDFLSYLTLFSRLRFAISRSYYMEYVFLSLMLRGLER